MPSSIQQFQEFWPVLLFVGLWVFVLFVISHLGWRSFALRYAAPTRPVAKAYNSPASNLNNNLLASYRNVVRVVFTEAGIYFYVLFLFRAFHPPFLVPWESVRRAKKVDGFWGSHYRIDIVDSAGEILVLLPTKVEHDLFRHYKAG
jgi:hypothetical protein